MYKVLFLAIGGAIGAVFRYVLSGMTYRYVNGSFPWGTMVVNLIGAFIIGFLWGISEESEFSPDFRTFLFIGLIGSFTTFSTYSLETFNLLRDGEIRFALMNFLFTNILSIVLVFAGVIISKYLIIFIVRR